MKQKFSTKWVSSKQPRKQRKYRANAPLHIKRKFMSVNLTKELRKKYGKRNFSIHKGDSIKIMRGEFKGKKGKIEMVDIGNLRVRIEGIYRTKKDGTKVSVYFTPSNLQINELNLEDSKRKKALERKTVVKDKIDNKNVSKSSPVDKTSKDDSVSANSKNEKPKFKPLPKDKKQGEEK